MIAPGVRSVEAALPSAAPGQQPAQPTPVKVRADQLSFFYGKTKALDFLFRSRSGPMWSPRSSAPPVAARALPADAEPHERHHAGAAWRARCSIDGRDIYGPESTSWRCVAVSAWCSRSPTRSRNRSSTTSLTGCESTGRRSAARAARDGSRRACRRPRSGTRSRIGCTTRRSRFRAVSSSGCVLRARSPSSRRSC